MKNKLIFSVAVIIAWYATGSLPIWRLEIAGVSVGYSLFDSMSSMVNDNHHLPFMFFSGPALALAAIINPKKLLLATFSIYVVILICGFLGFAFSEYVALKWGWYVHFIVMFLVVSGLGSKLLPEAFDKSN